METLALFLCPLINPILRFNRLCFEINNNVKIRNLWWLIAFNICEWNYFHNLLVTYN